MKLDPDKFPIDSRLPDIAKSLEDCARLLIKAETGAGKTTRLPPYLCQKLPGKVLVLEPRRLAAQLSAQRCASMLGGAVGERVGHHIRHDKKASAETQLLFITEGLFLPYLRQDPELSEYSVVVLDEFHERSIHTDVALALLLHLQKSSRPDLKIIVMSATLETKPLEEYLEGPKIFDIPGRVFPVEIEHSEMEPATAVEKMLQDSRCQQNILVFLPGMGAIRALERELKNRLPQTVDIALLHSSLSPEQQNKAFKGERRKIILSTNIAETSLTIPRVTGVIDLGLERRASFAPWSGMQVLLQVKISKASAIQRAGRAGRSQSGVVYRLYSEADFGQRAAFTPPEIARLELSHSLLSLIGLGFDPQTLHWLEAPDEKNLNRAMELLRALGAVEKESITLTDRGRFLAESSLHPRLAAMLYQCPPESLPDTLLAACVLSESMVLSSSAQFSPEDEETCDLALQMDLVKANAHQDPGLSDYDQSFLDRRKARRVLDLYSSLASSFGISGKPSPTKTRSSQLVPRLLAGFPDRVAAKREAKGKGRPTYSYNFCLGRGGKLSFQSSLGASLPPYIIVLEALENPRANAAIGVSITAASKVEEQALRQSNSPFLAQEQETVFNEKKGLLTIFKLEKYGKLTLAKTADEQSAPEGDALANLALKNWPWPFEDDWALVRHNLRASLLNQHGPPVELPCFEGEFFELFVRACAAERPTYPKLRAAGLEALISEQLSPTEAYLLENDAPEKITLSNGKSFAVAYEEEGASIEARIQDLYSVDESPRIAFGKYPLTIKLLSPANRVAQVTRDLPSFWRSSWPEVRKELKARYPKHFWPEDPVNAPPIRMASARKKV